MENNSPCNSGYNLLTRERKAFGIVKETARLFGPFMLTRDVLIPDELQCQNIRNFKGLVPV